ncbi:MAG TPA: BRCT domain-containing protein [Ramlibacter sp.]|nr:BRCT domain-containing protein [Ramlibacter sp.]
MCELALDGPVTIDIPERRFCFSGDFVFGPRTTCEQAIALRGGVPQPNVTKKLHYLVVGGLGSPEWKHGSFGTKVEQAITWRNSRTGIQIVHEDTWATALRLWQVRGVQ